MSNQSGVCSFALLNFPFSSLLFYKSVGLLNHLPVRFDLTLTSQWHPSLHFVIFQIPHFSALIGVPYLSSACALFFDTGTSMAPRPAPCENVFQIFPLPLTNTLIKLSNLLDICPCASHWQWHLNVAFTLYFIFIHFFLYTYYVFTSICLPHIYSFKFHFNCIF